MPRPLPDAFEEGPRAVSGREPADLSDGAARMPNGRRPVLRVFGWSRRRSPLRIDARKAERGRVGKGAGFKRGMLTIVRLVAIMFVCVASLGGVRILVVAGCAAGGGMEEALPVAASASGGKLGWIPEGVRAARALPGAGVPRASWDVSGAPRVFLMGCVGKGRSWRIS